MITYEELSKYPFNQREQVLAQMQCEHGDWQQANMFSRAVCGKCGFIDAHPAEELTDGA